MEILLGKLIVSVLIDTANVPVIKSFFFLSSTCFLVSLVSSMIRWKRLSVCCEKKMKEIDVSANTDEGAERGQDPAAIAGLDHVRLAVDHRLLLASVDLVVHRQSVDLLDHLYHFDRVVVLRNVDQTTDQEVAVFLSAGTPIILKKYIMRYKSSLSGFSSFVLVVADPDHIPAVSHRDYLLQETGIEREIGNGREKENEIANVIEIVIATEIAKEIEIAIYYLDIGHQ